VLDRILCLHTLHDGSANFCTLVIFQRKTHFTFHRRIAETAAPNCPIPPGWTLFVIHRACLNRIQVFESNANYYKSNFLVGCTCLHAYTSFTLCFTCFSPVNVLLVDPTCERNGSYLWTSWNLLARFYTPVLHTGSTHRFYILARFYTPVFALLGLRPHSGLRAD